MIGPFTTWHIHFRFEFYKNMKSWALFSYIEILDVVSDQKELKDLLEKTTEAHMKQIMSNARQYVIKWLITWYIQ